MRRHFKNKHPFVYVKETSSKESKNGSDSDTEYAVEYIIEEDTSNELQVETNSANKGYNSDENSSGDDQVTETEGQKIFKAKNIKKVEQFVEGKSSQPRKGWIKDYCQRINNQECKCSVCDAVLRMAPGIYGNMIRHFKRKHPFAYDQLASSKEYAMKYIIEENSSLELHDKTNSENEDEKLSEGESGDEHVEPTKSQEKDKFKNIKIVSQLIDGKCFQFRSGWIKDFCRKINDRESQCSVCSTVFKMGPGFYPNMRRHFKRKHPSVYNKEVLPKEVESAFNTDSLKKS